MRHQAKQGFSLALAAAFLFAGQVFCPRSACGDIRTPELEDVGYDELVELGYTPLFDGQTLRGWRNPYDRGEARAVDGEIHLMGDEKFFFVTEKKYSDFRLIVDIKLPEGPANSGVMFRCHAEPNRVYGYQAECDGSERRWSGGLYDETRRGWIWPSIQGRSEPEFLAYESESQAYFKQPLIRDALRRDDWNRYQIECRGDRLTIFVNGVKVTDLRDATDAEGYLAIQHHGEDGQVYRFRNLFIKELPQIPATDSVELTDQSPVSVKPADEETTFVDFGRVAFGNLRLDLPEDTSGPLTVRFGEKLRDDGRIDREPPGTVRYSEVLVEATGDEPLIVTPPVFPRTVQQASTHDVPAVLLPPEWGPITPFRWVEVSGLKAPLEAGQITRRAAFQKDWDDDAAAFECSDEMLNRVWELCHYSIKATTFAGVYVDGDRERIPYEADAYLNQLSHYYAEGDIEMARVTFDWLMENGTWPTEWAPHMVLMAHADWTRTGDAEWLTARYELLKTKTLLQRANEEGLVESNEQEVNRDDIVDWPVAERDGYEFTEVNTVVNAFHIEALNRMSELAEAVGEPAESEAFAAQAKKARAALNDAVFDEEAGLYADGVGTDHRSIHANLFPLAFGITPAENRESMADWLVERGMRCSVYAAQYLLEALFENGHGEQAVSLMIAEGDRSWRHMIESGATISWEAWDVAYKPNLDWNHAWGAAPANLLPRYVLGVEAESPGWESAQIKPCPSGLDHASGKVPTPHGPIEIDWTAGEAFTLRVSLPDGVAGHIRLPTSEGATAVSVDGSGVDASLEDGYWRLAEPIIGAATIELR